MNRPADRADAPRPDANLDLLIGILALRARLVGPEILRDALDDWVRRPGAASLADRLAEAGGLTPGERAALRGLAEGSLGRFGGIGEAVAALEVPGDLAPLIGRAMDLAAGLGARGDDRTPQMMIEPAREGFAGNPAPPCEAVRVEADVPATGADGRFGWRYRPLRAIGSGGAGEVFAAFDKELNREVALKVIRERLAADPLIRARFQMEAEITAGLEHAGVPAVYDLGFSRDGCPFYAMRLIRGETLRDAISRFHAEATPDAPGTRRLGLARLIAPLLSACRVAAYAHGRGVLHRDLKPGNILVTPHGEAFVADWGIAKMLDRPIGDEFDLPLVRPSAPEAVGETIIHRALGTPHYMSPEQAAGAPDGLGPATDVYGLGATLYQILTDRAPFDDGRGPDVADRVRRGDLVPPRDLRPDVPPELEAICLRAMALRPEDRHHSPAGLADDLEHWLVGLHLLSARPSL